MRNFTFSTKISSKIFSKLWAIWCAESSSYVDEKCINDKKTYTERCFQFRLSICFFFFSKKKTKQFKKKKRSWIIHFTIWRIQSICSLNTSTSNPYATCGWIIDPRRTIRNLSQKKMKNFVQANWCINSEGAETQTAEPHGPKFKIRGHSVARMPADVCRTLIKQTISDDSAVYFWLLNMSQNKMLKNSLKDQAQTKAKIFLLWKHLLKFKKSYL